MSANEDFRAALRTAGLDFDGEIIADGKLHRFKAKGDHSRNSWFVLHTGTPAAGAFGCWKLGFKETWCDRSGNLSQGEWNEVRRRWQAAEREREKAETECHAQARKTAAWILIRARPVESHPYLERKGVKPCGDVREYRGALVLPLRDASGELHSLQFIGPDGSKRFLTGGKIAGCFFYISDQPGGALLICEGYAMLIVEITGMKRDKAEKEWSVVHRWLPAVNAVRAKHDWPRWDWLHIDSEEKIADLRNLLLEKIKAS